MNAATPYMRKTDILTYSTEPFFLLFTIRLGVEQELQRKRRRSRTPKCGTASAARSSTSLTEPLTSSRCQHNANSARTGFTRMLNSSEAPSRKSTQILCHGLGGNGMRLCEWPPTHLQLLVLAPQERPRGPAHCVSRVPPGKAGLPEHGVHRVLHAPNVRVVDGAIRGELLPHYTRVWPGAGAHARDGAICRGEEVGVLGGRYESWDDHVAVGVVVFFELSGGSCSHVKRARGPAVNTMD